MSDLTFKKEERLKSKKVLARLFKEGRSLSVFPIRVVWVSIPSSNSPAPVQFTVSVPRKKFAKAVDRNRIKRQIREAYRLHKHFIIDKLVKKEETPQFGVMMIYLAKEKLPYAKIEKGMKGIIKRLIKELDKA